MMTFERNDAPMSRFLAWARGEAVLCVSLACALISCLFVPLTPATFLGIDFRVLALLFCLMAAVAGLNGTGLLSHLSAWLLRGARSARGLMLGMTLLCFFSSMAMTNDVALIAFVPLTLMMLEKAGLDALSVPLVALETVAANLGSALTPVGNPQNLYLYSAYQMTPGAFFALTVPLCALSLPLIVIAVFAVRGAEGSLRIEPAAPAPIDKGRLLLHGALFLLCLLTVFSVVDWRVTLPIVVLAMLLFDRPVLRRVDYALLLTFVCFFIFSGNLSRIPAVRGALTSLLERSAFFAALLSSQVISNVPAALVLSPFTKDARALLLGTDVGGLGTLVASLASLISFKYYLRGKGARGGRYLLVFTLLNLALLLPLIALSLLLLRAG
jgi:Na+/H+ antiporter NhaD/arsenite permease-like protein